MTSDAERLAAAFVAEKPTATPLQVIAWLDERHLLDPDYVARYLADHTTDTDEEW